MRVNDQHHIKYALIKDGIVINDGLLSDEFIAVEGNRRLFFDPYTTSQYGVKDATSQIVGNSKVLSK